MGQVFLSYASSDREWVRRLAQAIEAKGYTVWWDRQIVAGQTFDEVIEAALDRAKCVVVIWSATSVKSDWVKTEAAEAAKRKVLVPALIDDVKIPLEFRRVQAADLTQWAGNPDDTEFLKFISAIEMEIQSATDEAAPRTTVSGPSGAAATMARSIPQPEPAPQHIIERREPDVAAAVQRAPAAVVTQSWPPVTKWLLIGIAGLVLLIGIWKSMSPGSSTQEATSENGSNESPAASDSASPDNGTTDSAREDALAATNADSTSNESAENSKADAVSSFGAAIVFDPPSNIREAPNDSSDIVCSVRQKTTINLIERAGNWYTTDVCPGKIGYIHRSQLKFSE